ncbi:hypothetical protein BDV96DRAFT_588558 [Lophiotrema nucula]|uniref:Uncharacterized protein n=1 Tax=Lophiotrema nucula TaxID=690887 RepID=A0A6A5YKQ6_9PLEO|nr:hypothetical protein BDV96DRAFT_588558 [Lophiotrema nucula]
MCRRRNQTYIATSSAPLYNTHCRGRRQRHIDYQQSLVPAIAFPQTSTTLNTNPNPHVGTEAQTYLRPANCNRERKGRCCRNHTPTPAILATTTYANSTNPIRDLAQPQQHQNLVLLPPSSCGRRRQNHSGPVSAMASLVIAGIAIGAQKISDKRKEKKAQKAALGGVHGQVVERQVVGVERQGVEAQVPRPRKSEEARLERRSSSVYSNDGEALPSYEPPSYDDVVAGGAGGRGTRPSHA